MYKPKYKADQLINGTANNVCVVTGWTVKKFVASKIPPHLYSSLGNLYNSGRGLSILLRNLLCNGQIKYLAALNATREDKSAGSVKALGDFFREGFTEGVDRYGRKSWLVNSEVEGLIDFEIEREALELLRDTITFKEFSNIKDLANYLEQLPEIESARPCMEFPEPVQSEEIYPGRQVGHVVEGDTIADTWLKMMHKIRKTGLMRRTGYGGNWQELLNLTAVVTSEPGEFYTPEYLPSSKEAIKEYIPYMVSDYEVPPGGKYTYGQRMRSHFGVDQIQQVIDKLINEPDAASAVISLWDVEDHIRGGSPCLNHIWFRIRGKELILTALFRSNDMFAAWPTNAAGLIGLQIEVLEELIKGGLRGLIRGSLVTISESAHIYDDCFPSVDGTLEMYYKLNPKFTDPGGSYTIEITSAPLPPEKALKADFKYIRARWWTPDDCGTLVKDYFGTNAYSISRKIVKDNPDLETSHALYLGRELQKAEYCLINGEPYNQS